eukprot:gene14370-14471_t
MKTLTTFGCIRHTGVAAAAATGKVVAAAAVSCNECAPGLYNQDLQCVPCLKGKFCLGGGQGLLSDCPSGLATVIVGAKSRAQ